MKTKHQTLEEIAKKDFAVGKNHYCGVCLRSKKILYSKASRDYIAISYDCGHYREYIFKN